jgi:uncharacterized protein (DUF111 family)
MLWEQCHGSSSLHAHLDCANGASGDALLSACVDAASDNDSMAKDLVHRIESSVKATFESLEAGASSFGIEYVLKIGSIVLIQKVNVRDHYSGIGSDGSTECPRLFTYAEIYNAITFTSSLPDWVLRKALKANRLLAEAIAKVERIDSLMDAEISTQSIVQILGTLLCLHSIGVTSVSYNPIPLGSAESGSGSEPSLCSQALIMELLLGMATCPNTTGSADSTLSTPAGIAILRALTEQQPHSHSKQIPMVLRKIGAGRASAEENTAGIVRILVGEPISRTMSVSDDEPTPSPINESHLCRNTLESDLWVSDSLTHMETNLDDTTGETLGHVIELLLQNGAMDAWVTPIVMKKGRPANTLHCLCLAGGSDENHDATARKVLELIFRHTSTLGVRIYADLGRAKLRRSFVQVQTPYTETKREGIVDVKVGTFKNGDLISVKAEFDHCKEISVETGVPLNLISGYAVQKVFESYETKNNSDS